MRVDVLVVMYSYLASTPLQVDAAMIGSGEISLSRAS
jgi:hypothetical protein